MSKDKLYNSLIRLLALVREVKTDSGHTVESLYTKLGVSKSQLYRDKARLAQIGFVFNFDRGAGRFVIEKDCFLPVEGVPDHELLALILAAQQLAGSGEFLMAGRAREGARKLASRLDGNLLSACRELFAATSPGNNDLEGQEVLDALQEAIADKKRVTITYRKIGMEPEQYDVDPYTLFFQASLLYLDAYSLKAKEVRTFRVSRIQAVEPTDIHYGKTRPYDHATRYRDAFGIFTDATPQRVTLRFTRKVRPYIEEVRWHSSQTIEPQPDGSIIFTVEVSEPREVLWWALKWGDQAEILEPDWLREETRQTLERMLRMYGKG